MTMFGMHIPIIRIFRRRMALRYIARSSITSLLLLQVLWKIMFLQIAIANLTLEATPSRTINPWKTLHARKTLRVKRSARGDPLQNTIL